MMGSRDLKDGEHANYGSNTSQQMPQETEEAMGVGAL